MSMRMLAGLVLSQATTALGFQIDLDYSSSAYWHRQWPRQWRPRAYLDGSKGRDVLEEPDRTRVLNRTRSRTGFINPAGIGGGDMVQRCWSIFESDHEQGVISSGVYIGFNIDTLSSLQNVGGRHPLSGVLFGITTIIPSRRARYLVHPLQMMALIRKKMRNHEKGSPERKRLSRQLGKLRARKNDAPVVGDAPPHSSFVTILWHGDVAIRKLQRSALDGFLKRESEDPKSLFSRVAVV
jgi:hypothetical protein